MRRLIRLTILCFAAATAAMCTMQANEPAGQTEGLAPDRPPIAVNVARVAVTSVAETVDVVGSLAPKVFADVKSEITGVVSAVYVTEWRPVRKDAPLARLDASEAEAVVDALNAAVAQAKVALTRAEREHERALRLQRYGLITEQALDDAKSALEAADAAVAAAHRQVRTAEARLAKAFINAPIDGVVAQRRVNVGDRVENMGSGEPMFRIVDNRLLDLTVAVPSPRLRSLAVGQRVEFRTDARPGEVFGGRIAFINPSIDDVSRSVRVTAAVPNENGVLKGGLFVEGRILVATRSNVLQVPRDALTNWNMAAHTAEVWVVKDGVAQKRNVTLREVAGDRAEIVEGVSADDRVVVRGGFALHDGDRVVVAGG